MKVAQPGLTILSFVFHGGHFGEPAFVPWRTTEFCCQEGAGQVPRHFNPLDTATQTKEVHIVVFHSLLGGKVVFDQAGSKRL